MQHDRDKIQALLDSGTVENIELAFALMESIGEELILPTRADIADWILAQQDNQSYTYFAIEPEIKLLRDDTALAKNKQKEAIFLMAAKTTQELYVNNQKGLPNFVRWLKGLNSLSFYTNETGTAVSIDFPHWFRGYNDLKTIEFTGNFNFDLPLELEKTVREWNIYQNSNIQLPKGGFWEKLRTINISGSELHSIDFQSFPQLKKISIWNSTLRLAGYNFDTLQGLEKLYLSDNNLAELPENLACLNQLRVLSISANPLQHIGVKASDFPNLECLEISEKQRQNPVIQDFIRQFPAEVEIDVEDDLPF